MAYESKTKPTDVDPHAYIAAVDNPRRRADAQAVCALLQDVSGEPPVMWGPSIIGFGVKRYLYDSGHGGEICALGLSPRSANLVLYIDRSFPEAEALVARLGKVKPSKGCLYITDLSKVDMGALRDLAAASLAAQGERPAP